LDKIVYIIPPLFSLGDALMFRAKTKPFVLWGFNVYLEASKLTYIAYGIACIMLGMAWHIKYIVPLILLHFVCKSIPFNLVSGLKWNYIGKGTFDYFIRIVTMGSLWMWLLLQGICLTIAYFILEGRL
jgi:hypothetical protein